MKFRYPLNWPDGWPRVPRSERRDGRFRVGSLASAIGRVKTELRLLGVSSDEIEISLDRDGGPDPGVVVHWGQRCMAIDTYRRPELNLAAIAATLSAMRAVKRHGGAEILDRAFTGFVALPAPDQPWQTLGLAAANATADEIESAYRRLAMKYHPDRGGDAEKMRQINEARAVMLRK